jgi:hypothetical protein
MSRHRRAPSPSSSDSDERIGRKVEEELSSSSEDDVRNKPKKTKKPRNRLPVSRRTEIIQNKQRGIDDPEFCCTQNPKTKTWIVRKRKFPLDQTIRHQEPISIVKKEVVEEKKEPVKEVVKEPVKEDLQLSWANMQASANDTLTKQLIELSGKFDKLAGKYEEKKKAKAIKQKKPKPKKEVKPKKEEEYEYYSDEPPPRPPKPVARPATAPRVAVPARQGPIQRLPMGKYRRAGPLSISQF